MQKANGRGRQLEAAPINRCHQVPDLSRYPADHLRIDCLPRVRSVGEKAMNIRVGRAECS